MAQRAGKLLFNPSLREKVFAKTFIQANNAASAPLYLGVYWVDTEFVSRLIVWLLRNLMLQLPSLW